MVSLAIWVAAALFLGCVALVLFALGIAALESFAGWIADMFDSLKRKLASRLP